MEINEQLLYREYTIQKGNYAGTYRIYWNRKILELFEKDCYVFNWFNDNLDEIELKDGLYNGKEVYIESMDGTCVRIIQKKMYIDKKNRQFYFCRFPMTTVYYYYRRDGKKIINNFFGNVSELSRSSLKKTRNPNSRKLKAIFIELVLNGIDVFEAYKIAFKPTIRNYLTLKRRVLNMLNDKIVIRELKDQLKGFNDKLNEAFTDEMIIEELKSLIQNSRKGTMSHKENIKLIIDLKRQALEDSIKRNIEDAEYTELPPAELEE